MENFMLYFADVAVIMAAGLLTAFSPDILSVVVVAVMALIVVISSIFGVVPLIQYCGAFRKALSRLLALQNTQTESRWLAVQQMDHLFDQRTLDRLFDSYKENVQTQRRRGLVAGSVDEALDEETLALQTWQSVMQQIPGTLTGIGLLGTFIGLITGINSIEFSSVDAAITSIQLLLNGIRMSFYTSVAGVILSLLFNTLYRLVFSIMRRERGLFVQEFERSVIPSEKEQTRYRGKRDMQQILERLDRIPKNSGYSLANEGGQAKTRPGNERILMPQILSGLQNGEFTFYLQPRFDLNTHKMIGAEALVRWNHKKLGIVPPAVFIPTLESNGYITKLDQYVWEQVCQTIRQWIDQGIRPVPISVNISKTDILAIDIVQFFTDTVHKYRLPPRSLELDIAQNAYLEAQNAVMEVEHALRQAGFRVAVDGFTGDYVALMNSINHLEADALKMDLRFMAENKSDVTAALDQAAKMKVTLIAEGIETMEQLTLLRRSGCTEGQGYYLSKPMSIQEFEGKLTRGERAESQAER